MRMNKHIVLIFVLFLIPPLIIPSVTYAQNNQTSSSRLDEMLQNAKKSPEPEKTGLNFTRVLSTLTDYPLVSGPLVEVEYQSNSMVVLKADESYLLGVSGSLAGTGGTMAAFWKAIDIIKQYGYTVDDVTTSGVGSQGNPTRFYAIMSKP
jgi:hypothetical protein